MSLYGNLFYTPFTQQLCSQEHFVDLMIKVELALAKAQEQHNIIPPGTTNRLSDVVKTMEIDFEVLKNKIALTGNAAAPLVKQFVAAANLQDTTSAKYIHLGATSQDIVDTATVLKIKDYLNWTLQKIEDLENALIHLTEAHKESVMIGRSLMQQARPITFGLKTAGWLKSIRSSRKQIQLIANEILTVQLGGAVGSQNQYINPAVRQSLAEELQLRDGSSWHTDRTSVATLASMLGILMGNLAKIANDIVLLSQTEVGEVSEPEASGRGTSSTMPHKRNPILSITVLANAHRLPFLVASVLAAMPHTHERSAGKWHSEWETLDDIMGLVAGALKKAIELIQGLEVDKGRMRHNIDLTNGLIYAETLALHLAEILGKQEAHELVKKACQKSIDSQTHLRTVLEGMNDIITSNDYDQLFKPENAIGFSLEIIDEILAHK